MDLFSTALFVYKTFGMLVPCSGILPWKSTARRVGLLLGTLRAKRKQRNARLTGLSAEGY